METKNITVRIPSDMYEDMQRKSENSKLDAGSINQQIVESLRALNIIRYRSLGELRGRFTSQEWAVFADLGNGTRAEGDFRYLPLSIISEIEDGETFDGTCSKWGVDKDKLVLKCKQLTAAQMDALYMRVEDYWARSSFDTDILEWGKF